MKKIIMILMIVLLGAGSAMAGPAEPLKALAEMKIKEVTVFKDGHVFVLHDGKMPVNASGKVVMDYLPVPVLGTYWPYSSDRNAKLRAVTAGKRKVIIEKTALSIREMIEANIGARVIIKEKPESPSSSRSPQPYEAMILEIPTRSGEELEELSPSSSDERLPEKGKVVMLKVEGGVKALQFDRILDVTFANDRKKKVPSEEFRNLLTLDLEWKGKVHPEAEVGMIYLQKGIRWIPSYKITINENGKAVIKLEATLVNELTDISDVTAHLVIGVPSFAFKESIDPISLRQDVARLSSHLRRDSRTAMGFSRAIMSQQAAPARGRGGESREAAPAMDLGPELGGAMKSEDLYMFTIRHISLRKGERIVMPITQAELSYKDIYALDIPFAPPVEVLRNLNNSQRMDLMRMHAAPKVKHKIRIVNKSKHPFTTAPAMIMKGNRIIAQGMMTYTPVGSDVDIELTTAVDIKVKKVDNETKRTPNAVIWNRDKYTRIDLEGTITLTNYKQKTVIVEIVRHVLGNVVNVGQQGEKEMVNPFEDISFLPNARTSTWWYGYSWPWWWYRFNGIGRIKWTATIEPKKSSEHTYSWHYFWR
ncbi:hypothetical protein ACFL2O_08365 [Thermodesulfobacteriota bacterium]